MYTMLTLGSSFSWMPVVLCTCFTLTQLLLFNYLRGLLEMHERSQIKIFQARIEKGLSFLTGKVP